MKIINGFDIDGVLNLGNGKCGIHPGPNDVIITGRSYEEIFYEDDEIQKAEIEKGCDWVKVIHVCHDFTPKENMRHWEEVNG